MMTPEEQQQFIAFLVDHARQQPGGRFDLRDARTHAVVATIQAHDLPKRPQDMPRALRPKQQLSKRARDAAKAQKLRPVAS